MPITDVRNRITFLGKNLSACARERPGEGGHGHRTPDMDTELPCLSQLGEG